MQMDYFWPVQTPNVKEDKITSFLPVTLICNTVQAEKIRVLRLEVD